MHFAFRVRVGGFSLTEPLVALAVIAVVASSTLFSLFASNRHAATQRLLSGAKALCQERIDQALTEPFNTSRVPPFFGGVWPLPQNETLTTTEVLPLYLAHDSANNPLVTATRRTWVTGFAPVAGNPYFVYARVRVRVEFWNNGRGIGNRRSNRPGAEPLFYEMTTLRSPD